MSNPIVEMLRSQIGKPSAKTSPSPVAAFIGGTIKSVESGEIVVTYKVERRHTNPMGTIHGGVVSLLIDEVIGMTTYSMNNDYFYTSIDLTVNFLSSAKVGDLIDVKATVIRKGRKVIHVAGEITKADGKIIARASSNMGVTPVKNTLKL